MTVHSVHFFQLITPSSKDSSGLGYMSCTVGNGSTFELNKAAEPAQYANHQGQNGPAGDSEMNPNISEQKRKSYVNMGVR